MDAIFDKISITFNKISISLPEIAAGIIFLLIMIVISIFVKRIVSKRIKPKSRNPLLADFFAKLISLILILIGIIFFLELIGLGSIAGHLLAGAGVVTFIIGFAFKDIGENFLSGIILAFNSPFGINDMIETENTVGVVTMINLRETVIKTPDGKDVFIPNSQILKNPLINYTIDGYLRYDFIVGLDYESDVRKAIETINNELENIPEVITEKKHLIVIDELMASTINLKVFFWIDTFSSKSRSFHLKIRSKVISQVVKSLIDTGFYLPSDIIEIKNHNNSKLDIDTKKL